jgi:hypothetical protein
LVKIHCGMIGEFVAHYHLERNHQGLGNRLIVPMETTTETTGAVERRQRLGGLLNYYYRQAGMTERAMRVSHPMGGMRRLTHRTRSDD